MHWPVTGIQKSSTPYFEMIITLSVLQVRWLLFIFDGGQEGRAVGAVIYIPSN